MMTDENMYMYIYNPYARCPYCDHIDREWCNEYSIYGNEEKFIINCDQCGKDFFVIKHIVNQYSTVKP